MPAGADKVGCQRTEHWVAAGLVRGCGLTRGRPLRALMDRINPRDLLGLLDWLDVEINHGLLRCRCAQGHIRAPMPPTCRAPRHAVPPRPVLAGATGGAVWDRE
jgi:hypothetical protein